MSVYLAYLKRLYKFYLLATPAYFISIQLTIMCPITGLVILSFIALVNNSYKPFSSKTLLSLTTTNDN